MTTKFIQHGDDLALVIDRAMADALQISAETPVDVVREGGSLLVRPHSDDQDERSGGHWLDDILREINQTHGDDLRRLAE